MEKHTPTRRPVTDWIGNQRKTWWGPYAIATVCGTGYEPAYQVAKNVRGKRHAKGITISDLKASCKAFGVKGEWHPISSVGAGNKSKILNCLSNVYNFVNK